MHDNLFAYTAPGASYPEFVSLNVENGTVSLTVRSPATFDVMQSDNPPLAVCGPTAKASLPLGQLISLRDALNRAIDQS